MKKTFNASICISAATGMIGRKLKGTTLSGELYVDGNETDFAAPAGRRFKISGKVVEVMSKEAIDLLRKYDMYDSVVGKELGNISVMVGQDMVARGSWDDPKFELLYTASVQPCMTGLDNVEVRIDVKGFVNSMAVDDVVIRGSAVQVQKEKNMKKKAEKIDKVKVVQGRLVRVVNTKKAKLSNANDSYLAVWVENADGDGERCLLFTEDQINDAEYRASKNKEDLTKKGFMANLFD